MKLEIFIAITGAITGILGLVISCLGYWRNRAEAVSHFFSLDQSPDMIRARGIIYRLEKDYINTQDDERDKDISFALGVFEYWGVLVKKHQLPYWIFKNRATGICLVQFYSKLEPTIKARQKYNPYQGVNYEWLVNRLRKTLKRKGKEEFFDIIIL